MLQINFSNSFDKTKSFTVNGYVVFQFYPWFKFNFPLFQTTFLRSLEKREKKITPVMQANTSAISKCRRMSPLIFFPNSHALRHTCTLTE